MTIQLERPQSASAATDPASLVRRHVPGHSLEAPFYSSAEIFDLDMKAIFFRHWIFAAAEAELPEPGDYVTVTIGHASVIVVRDDDEQVRAFHNVCRHRGSRLLDDASGSVGNIVCPYHHWTYGVDGGLLHAENQPATFDKCQFGLKPVHVRNVAGLVFICLADEPPADFDTEVVPRVEPYLTHYQMGKAKVAHQIDLVERGNWKLTMENNRECYHCDGHPELLSAYFPLHGYTKDDVPPRLRRTWERFEKASESLEAACRLQGFPDEYVRELDTRTSGFMIGHLPLDGAGESYSVGGKAVVNRRMGDIASDSFGDLHLHTQPNAWFHMLSDHAVVFTVLPLTKDSTLVRTTWLVHPDAVEGVDYDVDNLVLVWKATNAQDAAFVERTQLGVEDPGYQPGPYSEVEGDVEAFVSWYVQRVDAYLAAG